MPSLIRRAGRKLSQATFDERLYRRCYPDVSRAVSEGALESGYLHYVSSGRREGRYARRLWMRAPLALAALVKPQGDYFSGMRIVLGDAGDGVLRLRLYRLGASGLTGVKKVADVEIDAAAELENGVGYVMWEPIAQAKGAKFVVRVSRRRDGERETAVALALADNFVFSDPDASTATPTLVAMSPLTQCNLNCIHCISRATRTSMRELSPEIWRGFQDLAARGDLHHMCADYSGDIFYAQGRGTPWLDRLLDLNIELRFDTHANNLTPEIADKILRSRLIGVNFSIDSHDPDDYPLIRRGARPLDEVLGNIAMFMARRRTLRPELETSLSLVLMRRNLTSLIPAIDFARQHGIGLVQGVHLMAFTPDMAAQHALLDLARYREHYEKAEAHARACGVRFEAPRPLEMRKPRKGHLPCPMPWVGVQVTGDGKVAACCMPGSVVGDLNRQSLAEIWRGEAMRAFRARVNTPDPPDPCATCGIYRHANNLESYVPGLSKIEQAVFVQQVLAQFDGNEGDALSE